mmetsp:Transcript_16361/g.29928  ORF Transcript_16361/g.29928 Transcript_16361/m.29928 type:complete len:104 (-) Transcript_16361:82-393(-)
MHGLIGTKTGHLLLYNLTSGQVLDEIAAHDDAIWSIDIRPDGKGFVTGSADKQVKFWEFELEKSQTINLAEGQSEEEKDDEDDDGNNSDSSDSSSSTSSSSSS